MHIFRFLQKYLIGFKLRLWLGHSRTFTALCISHACSVFRVTVLLEPSAQSEVLNALDWVFIKAISIFGCIELFFYSDESLSPCCWKTAPQHDAVTSTLYFWDVLCRRWAELVSSNMMLRIEVHQTRDNYSSVLQKLTCTWSPEQVSNLLLLTVSSPRFLSFPRVLRIDSVSKPLDGGKEQTWSVALPVKTNQFMIYYQFIRECHNRKWSLWHTGKAK